MGFGEWLGSAGNAISAAVNSTVKFGWLRSGIYVAETQKDNTPLTSANKKALEDTRQQFQAAQLKLSIVQQRENRKFQETLIQLNQEQQKKIEEFRQNVNWAINQNNLDFQRWRFEQEKELQLEIIAHKQEFDRQLATYQRETALKSIEEQKRSANSPIWLVASDILHAHQGSGIIPLRVLLSPPELDYDKFGDQNQVFRIEGRLSEELRQFINKNYSFNSELRPIELLDGAWESKKFRGGASIQSLHTTLKGVPILILESEVDGDYLNFRFAYWGLAQAKYTYETIISRLPYREILFELAKERALKWKEIRTKLLEKGRLPEEVDQLGGDNAENLKILEQEEELKEAGIDTTELPLHYNYKINKKDLERLCQFLVTCHCLIVGWVADIYYLTHTIDVPPILPQLLPKLLKDIPEISVAQDMVNMVISGYREIYADLKSTRPNSVPDLMLELAQTLTELSDKTWGREQINVSIRSWLELREIAIAPEDDLLEVLKANLKVEDQDYAQKIREYLAVLGDENGVIQIDAVLNLMENLKQEKEAIEQKNKLEQESKGTEFYFEIITVNFDGQKINRRRGCAHQKIENLDDVVSLEMVYIPEGTFMMGSPLEEEGNTDTEKPQHSVTIKPFFMSKYPVTQAQWKAVAKLPPVDRELEPDPSKFRGDFCPVERVSWYDAVEFCLRLSQKTGQEYRLPSEAQWEYACRAGTTTPFYFGETITTDLANYDGNSTYGGAPKGKYHQETTPVDSFPSNAFGLCDLHGNVWEWCADYWHGNYEDAPTDDSAWLANEDNPYHVLRGGSWYIYPKNCRSAHRTNAEASYSDLNIGFRIVAVTRN